MLRRFLLVLPAVLRQVCIFLGLGKISKMVKVFQGFFIQVMPFYVILINIQIHCLEMSKMDHPMLN